MSRPARFVMQKKTRWPVQFEITERTRDAVAAWITAARLKPEQFLFPSRVTGLSHLSTRQHSWIVGSWVGSIGCVRKHCPKNDAGTGTVGAFRINADGSLTAITGGGGLPAGRSAGGLAAF
jgi:hypothetical protein